jgi:diaminopimelate decarboxylase
MTKSSSTIDCRGLTMPLSILRIKQTICSGQSSYASFDVVLGEECIDNTLLSKALGEIAGRVRYISADAGPSPEVTPELSRRITRGVLESEYAVRCIEPSGGAAAVTPWWQRHDLRYHQGRLHFGEIDIDELATQVGTPAYVCRAARVRENIERLSKAMSSAGIEHQIYYAMKANRSTALLSYLRTLNLCGVDVCSVGELMNAFACGFSADAISFTGTSLSAQDIEALSRFTRIRVNLDSLSSLNSLGQVCPGRSVGLRINPGVGVGYHGNGRLKYSGARTTKFGIYVNHVEEAKAIAAKWNLRIVRIHVHAGCGYLDAELGQFEDVLDAAGAFTEHFPDLEEINIGGGLGVPHTSADEPLDLQAWAAAIARRFANRGVRVAVEPGDYLVKDAGLLLATVTYVERRRDVLFAGLDAGFNLAMEPAFYGLPCEPVAVTPRWGDGSETYTVVGNINEALDQWAVDHRMTRVQGGDYVALLNSGGYAASMRSDHCLRGGAREIVLIS